MSKDIWRLSTRTPFGYDHYELVINDGELSETSGSVKYGQTDVSIEKISVGKGHIKTKFSTDIPISEEVEISLTGLEEEMFGFVKIGPHTTVEAFATKVIK